MLRASFRSLLAIVFIAGLWPATGLSQAQAVRTSPFVGQFAARAIDPSDPASRSRVDIMIEHWSSDADAAALRSAIAHGPDTLLPALQKMWHRVGFIRTPGMQAHGTRSRDRWAQNVLFARQVKTADGLHVIVATERRPILTAPTAAMPRTFDPEFTLIDMRIDADGKGIGKMAPASGITYNEAAHTIEIENFASQPVRLTDITSAMR